jgi:hypothetical protein
MMWNLCGRMMRQVMMMMVPGQIIGGQVGMMELGLTRDITGNKFIKF